MFYIHHISSIYHSSVATTLPNGRHVFAVAEPYTSGRLRAAWAVLRGHAYALEWPKAGDLEAVLAPDTMPTGTLLQGTPKEPH